MFSLFILLSLITIAKTFDYYRNNKKYINKKWNDFNSLKNSVKYYHPKYSKFEIYYNTLKLVFHKYKEEYIQTKFGITSKLNGNFCITYYKNFREYKVLIKKGEKRKIMRINIYNNEIDITEQIKPFMGPNYDFHNLSITCKDLGYDNLLFVINDREIEFNKDDVLNLTVIDKEVNNNINENINQ
jgi:hypothetical protein